MMLHPKDQAEAFTEAMNPLYSGLSEKKANLILLILASQNIKPVIEHLNDRLTILIRESDYHRARASIEAYYSENRFFGIRRKIDEFEADPFKSLTALLIMAVLCAVHFLLIRSGTHHQAVREFGSSALYILQGERFRVITALLLHADVRHLLANCAGILIFCAPLLNLTGYGNGVLLLVVSGAMGNQINAWFYKTAHLSIGSSTAIMAAAGLLAAHRMIYSAPGTFKKTLGLAAGASLVALFSGGETTDVSAHIFGFCCGLLTGLPFFALTTNRVKDSKIQAFSLISSLVLISAAGLKLF